MLWKDVSFILGSPLCKKILETLLASDKPLAPIQISRKTNIAQSNISTKMKPLVKRGLVKCINPEARKWRFYTATSKGRSVFKEIQS